MASINDNVNDRTTAAALHRMIGELILGELPKLPSDRSRSIFWELMLESVKKNVPQKKHVIIQTDEVPIVRTDAASIREAENLINEINDMAGEVPERGEEFADSVVQRTNDIGDTIERTGSVTDGQLTALENMRDGLAKWLHR